MKTNPVRQFCLACCIGLCAYAALGHDVPVHRAISSAAVDSALEGSSAFNNFFDAVSSDLIQPKAIDSMISGSALEDNSIPPLDEGGLRSVNHFYDPLDNTYEKGLSDAPPDSRLIIGVNSFTWGSVSNCAGVTHTYDPHPVNMRSWQNARGYEWIGLTATNQSDRVTALTNMFRSVGQVMHLVQDLSQPQHVRNEQHLSFFGSPWRSPIETYGKEHLSQLNYEHGMLDWRGAGFSRLEDFWDTHSYNGNPAKLNADVSATQLGLAEWCNGNFIGARHTYAEFFSPGGIAYYPLPSLANTTQHDLKLNHFGGVMMDTITLENQKQGNRLYISKMGAGVNIAHHSALNYLAVAHPPKSDAPNMQVGLTINDTNVLREYHDIFIPKAVEYSAGLLDYYFRGTLSSSIIGFDTNAMQYTNLIVNTCDDDFKGGAFSIYQDSEGGRSLLTNLSLGSGTLASGDSLSMTFPAPTSVTNKLLLVYQGTIGLTGTSASDSVDAGLAIAVTTPQIFGDMVTPDIFNGGVSYFEGGLSFPAGTYKISYVNGALQYGAGQDWCLNNVAVGGDGYSVVYSGGENGFPDCGEGFSTQAEVEEANAGESITITHSGGPIGIHFQDDVPLPGYEDNVAGSPNPTFLLLKL